ncbi:MAG: hypothetical protein LIR46_01565 [Bacteroidota bacterium]|nr:hypothetical protein [Bacteroidota bacterium]
MKNGCILCSRTGSGKSRTALAYYYIRNGGDLDAIDVSRMVNTPKDLYIITTAKKRDDAEWVGEMAPFLLTPNEDLKIYNHKIVIDSWNNIQKYKEVKDSFFIFDEDRVTGDGKWVKAFLKIARNNEWIILSATPGDNWIDYIPVFIANGFYKNKTDFENQHVIYKWRPGVKYKTVHGYIRTSQLHKFRNIILIDMDFERPTVSHHEDRICAFDRDMYNFVMKKRWNFEKEKPIENISELCYCLRKLVNCDQSREVMLLELYEKHPRLIVFYNLDCELLLLRELCKNNGIVWTEWNGHKHEDVPTGENWMYFVQYNAGAEAWNCITTDTIIFFSQTYSYKTLVQAAGRIDRMNTPYRDLYYYHFKSKAPIDLGISMALKNKKKFNESRFIGG